MVVASVHRIGPWGKGLALAPAIAPRARREARPCNRATGGPAWGASGGLFPMACALRSKASPAARSASARARSVPALLGPIRPRAFAVVDPTALSPQFSDGTVAFSLGTLRGGEQDEAIRIPILIAALQL